jgi:hypothetical protein
LSGIENENPNTMKKQITFFIILLCFCTVNLKAQIDYGWYVNPVFQCDFETTCPKINLHPEVPYNLWQVGIPSKTVFDSAYSPQRALVTDTSNTYPMGNDSWFDVKLWIPWEFTNPLVSFYHKWDMDSLTEGAWIDISYNNGLSWKNIIYDTAMISYNWPFINSVNLYGVNDTLNNGTPAFTGNSNGWVLTQFQWIWFIPIKDNGWPENDTILLRFHFLSDSNETAKDGWMIDDFHIDDVQFPGSIKEYGSLGQLKLWPNPITDELNLRMDGQRIFSAEVFSYEGRLVCAFSDPSGLEKLSTQQLKPGLYWVMIKSDDGKYMRQCFVKE